MTADSISFLLKFIVRLFEAWKRKWFWKYNSRWSHPQGEKDRHQIQPYRFGQRSEKIRLVWTMICPPVRIFGETAMWKEIFAIYGGGDRWRTSRNCRCRRRGRPIIPPVAGSGSWLSSSLPLLASCWGGEIFAVDSHYSGMPEDFCFIRYLVAEIQTAQIRLKCKPFIYTGMTEILPIWKSRALKQIPESAGRMLTFSSKNSKKRKGDQTETYIYSIYN